MNTCKLPISLSEEIKNSVPSFNPRVYFDIVLKMVCIECVHLMYSHSKAFPNSTGPWGSPVCNPQHQLRFASNSGNLLPQDNRKKKRLIYHQKNTQSVNLVKLYLRSLEESATFANKRRISWFVHDPSAQSYCRLTLIYKTVRQKQNRKIWMLLTAWLSLLWQKWHAA